MLFSQSQNNVPFTNTQGAALAYSNVWVSATSYVLGDIVQYGAGAGVTYYGYFQCILAVTGGTGPHLDTTHWSLMSPQPVQYINAGDICNETGVDPFSISVWVKFNNISTWATTNPRAYRIISKSNVDISCNFQAEWHLGFYPYYPGIFFTVNSYQDPFNSQEGYLELDNPGTLFDMNWHHVVVVWSSTGIVSNAKIYLDGSLTSPSIQNATFDAINYPLTNNGPITIGANSNNRTALTGSVIVSNVSKWPISLSQAQVTAIYNSGHAGDLRALAFWSSLASSTRGFWYPLGAGDRLVSGGYVYDHKDSNLYHAAVVSNQDALMPITTTSHS